MSISSEIALGWMSKKTFDDVSVGSGNVLVPSGNKPLPDTILTQIFLALWHY